MDKLDEECAELLEASRTGEGAGEELGDVLFAAVSVAVRLGVDPEEALHHSSTHIVCVGIERRENIRKIKNLRNRPLRPLKKQKGE